MRALLLALLCSLSAPLWAAEPSQPPFTSAASAREAIPIPHRYQIRIQADRPGQPAQLLHLLDVSFNSSEPGATAPASITQERSYLQSSRVDEQGVEHLISASVTSGVSILLRSLGGSDSNPTPALSVSMELSKLLSLRKMVVNGSVFEMPDVASRSVLVSLTPSAEPQPLASFDWPVSSDPADGLERVSATLVELPL